MIGRTLGHYEILEKIGEGGMGAVYKARDTRLDRIVALKILPPEKLGDPDRRRRFAQEARSASALNHPNIVTIYDIASEDGVDYIAMEYVQGRTLDAIILRGGMRVSEVLKCARQMADALAAAHAAGILHRDLKPANVMVTDSGLVKILDFGLAKLTGRGDTSETDATRTAVTQEGQIVGTIAYMSPEQAEGKNLDFRSDIFSFGAVLYEMVTGRRAFRGDSQASTLSAVLRDEPKPAAELREDVPGDLDRLIVRCLRKDAARRVQTMADLKVALEDLVEDSKSAATVAPKRPAARRRKLLWPIAAAVLIAIGAGAAYLLTRGTGRQAAEAPMSVLPLTGNPGLEFEPTFSPDGNQVAYSWNGEKEDNFDIYVKLIGPGAPLRLTTDPEPDRGPAWSPDGRWIAFLRGKIAQGSASIMMIPALGGSERKLLDIYLRLGPRSLAWSSDSQNLFFSGRLAPQDANGLFVLSVATGETRKLTTPPVVAIGGDGDPALSPDGHTVAFMRGPSGSNLGIFTLALTPDLRAAAEPKQITDQRGRSTQPAWSPDGRDIIFSVESQGGRNLWRAPADGSEKPRRMPGIGEGGSVPAISVRAHRLVYSRHAADDNIWRLDTRTGAATRFVSNTLRDLEPRYSPDGRRVAFTSNRSGQIEVWTAEADGSNQVQLTDMKTSITSAPRWSPDGRQIVFISTLYGQSDVFVMGAAGGAPRRLTDTPSHDTAPAWSHDGKWIYFSSNRGGDFQIYKMPAAGGQAIQVTKKGGYAPLESPDGRSIYYARRSTLDGVWQVPVDGGDEVQVTPGIDLWGNFAVVDSGIFFVPKEKGAIQFFDFATRQVKTIARVDKPITFGLTATADGRTVLYTQTDREIDELILVEDFH